MDGRDFELQWPSRRGEGGKRHTLDDGLLVEGADGGEDQAGAPEVLALLGLLEVLNLLLHSGEHADIIRIPLLLLSAPERRDECGTEIHVVDAIVQELLAHLADELAEDGLVKDEGSEKGEAGHELPPDLVGSLVVQEMLFGSDGGPGTNPLNETLAATLGEAICSNSNWNSAPRLILLRPDRNVCYGVLLGVCEGDVTLLQGLG